MVGLKPNQLRTPDIIIIINNNDIIILGLFCTY